METSHSDAAGPSGVGPDLFTDAYLVGVTVSLEDLGGAAGLEAEPAGRVMAGEAYALGGEVLTPAGPQRGWVTIEEGRIVGVSARAPEGVGRVLETDGVITPGLIDLHGHPEFNIFAPWEPPRLYVNRYAWRDSEAYRVLIRAPQNRLLAALPTGTQLRYAEIRALVGGVTAVQGAGQRSQGATESLVRNVDGLIFGQHRARSLIDPIGSRAADDLARIVADIHAGEVDAFYVHLAEGGRDNERSVAEFDALAQAGAVGPATVIIHGTAMTRDQLAAAGDAGAKLVWSPQSNLRLYGQTTRAADALELGLPVGLGADWLPSGSMGLLGEMKVARQELANQRRPVAAADLVAMVTSGAAAIAGLSDHLGAIEPGRLADLVVFTRTDPDPYESVCRATDHDVDLVVLGGDPVYARSDWIAALVADPDDPVLEPVIAWGRPMRLHTGFQQQPDGTDSPRLEQLRAALTTHYPPVGPIWA